MKAIKKWLLDKEGLFIVITWWFIAFVIFTIILGTSINKVSKNLDVTKETSPTYVQEFIESGDNVIPYNENISSVSVGVSTNNQNVGVYKLDIRQYNHRYSVPFTQEFEVVGAGRSKATISYDLEVVEQYFVSYNYSAKQLSISLVQVSTEKASEAFPASLKKTDSGSIHVLWNKEDTGVEIKVNQPIEITKQDEFVVINGQVTTVEFYTLDGETGKPVVEYDKKTPTDPAKVIPFELIVEYKINSKEYTTKQYSTEGLTANETVVVNDAAVFYTQMIEGSIGINSSSFTLLIVSAVVDSLLLISGIVGIVLLKRSKED